MIVSALGDDEQSRAIPAVRLLCPDPESPQQAAFLETYLLNLNALTQGPSVNRLSLPSFGSMKPRHPFDIADIIGAGDVFMAALVMRMLRHKTSKEIDERFNHIATSVCSWKGFWPELPAELAS